jgi:hypothetical protein
MQKIQGLINRCISKENMVPIYGGYYSAIKMRKTCYLHQHIYSWKSLYTKENKPGTEREVSCDIIHMWNNFFSKVEFMEV